MAKLLLPFSSIHARGALADALIYSRGRKNAYAKTHRRPRDPKTSSQLGHRAAIGFLSKEWSRMSPDARTSWLLPGRGNDLSAYHFYLRFNQRRWVAGQYPIDTFNDFTQTTPGVFTNPNWDEQENQWVSRSNILPKNDSWAHIWYMYYTEYGPLTVDWAVTVSGYDDDGFGWHVHTDMRPGEYWYRVAHFTRSGTFTGEDYGTRIIL